MFFFVFEGGRIKWQDELIPRSKCEQEDASRISMPAVFACRFRDTMFYYVGIITLRAGVFEKLFLLSPKHFREKCYSKKYIVPIRVNGIFLTFCN